MWKVGGIEIELAMGRQSFFLQTDMKIVKNKIFFLLVGNNKEICDESKKVKRQIKIGEQTPLRRKFAARQF